MVEKKYKHGFDHTDLNLSLCLQFQLCNFMCIVTLILSFFAYKIESKIITHFFIEFL
jgi:hypothetical protein